MECATSRSVLRLNLTDRKRKTNDRAADIRSHAERASSHRNEDAFATGASARSQRSLREVREHGDLAQSDSIDRTFFGLSARPKMWLNVSPILTHHSARDLVCSCRTTNHESLRNVGADVRNSLQRYDIRERFGERLLERGTHALLEQHVDEDCVVGRYVADPADVAHREFFTSDGQLVLETDRQAAVSTMSERCPRA